MKQLILSFFTSGLLILTMSACESADDGPFEKAGENIDKVVNDTKDKVQEAVEEVEEEIDDATDS